MQAREHFYIDGQWLSPADRGAIDVRSAATEEIIGRVPRGRAAAAAVAVGAARRAFERWSQTTAGERAEWLRKLADALESRVEDIATTISQEVGMPITMSTPVQAQLPVTVARAFATIAGDANLEERIG